MTQQSDTQDISKEHNDSLATDMKELPKNELKIQTIQQTTKVTCHVNMTFSKDLA